MTDDGSHLASILEGAAITLTGKLVGTVLGFAGTLLITNLLGASVFGGFRYGIALLNVSAVVAALGMNDGVTRFIGRESGAAYFSSAVGVAGTFSFVLGAGLFTAAPVIAEVAFEPDATIYLQGAAIAVPLLTLGNIAIAAARGQGHALPGTLFPDIARPLVKFLGVAVVVSSGLGAAGLAGIIPLMTLVICIGAWAYLWGVDVRFMRPSRNVTRSILTFSIPLVLSQGIWFVMNNADTILIGYFRDQAAVGVYAAAFSLAVLLNLIVNSVGALFMPNVAKLADSGDYDGVRRVYQTGTRWMLVAAVPIAFGLFSFPDIALRMFGSEFPAAAGALLILAIGFLTHIVAGLNSSALKALDETRIILLNQVATVVVNIVLNVILIPPYGFVGAAIATTTSFGISNLLHNIVLYRTARIVPLDGKTAVATVTALSSGVVIARITPIDSLILAMTASLLFALLWAGGCLHVGLISPDSLKQYVA